MAQENDIWSALPRVSFRGVEFPINSRNVNHSFEHTESGQYRQGAFTEVVGDGAWRFRYEIPMKQGFQTGWKDVLKNTYPALMKAYEDRTPGWLSDPLLGSILVIPGTWEEQANSEVRNGVSVSIEFVKTVLPGEEDLNFVVDNDAAVAAMSNEYFEQPAVVDVPQYENEPPRMDPFRQLAGSIEKFRADKRVMIARLEAVNSNVNSVMDSADRAKQDPSAKSQVIAEGRKLRATAARLLNYQISSDGKNRFYLIPRPMSMVALARTLKCSLEDLLDINKELTKLPQVEAGRKVWVPRNAGK